VGAKVEKDRLSDLLRRKKCLKSPLFNKVAAKRRINFFYCQHIGGQRDLAASCHFLLNPISDAAGCSTHFT